MSLNIAATNYGGGGVQTESNPYMDTRLGGGAGFNLGFDPGAALRLKIQLALRNQALKEQQLQFQQQEEQQADFDRREMIRKAGVQHETPYNASNQADALTPTFGVRGLGNTLQAWHPGMALGPGQDVEATGFLPHGYSAAGLNGPSAAGFSGGSGGRDNGSHAGLDDIYADEERATKAEFAKRQLAHANDSSNETPKWWA